jgi:CBS domain-containing protein
MKVKTLMTREVVFCEPNDPMSTAAHLMWDNDCGVVPVVNEKQVVVGMVTDRDLCMASLLGGRPLSEMPVREAMSPCVVFCSPGDELRSVHGKMREHQIRRLPVVNDENKLVGIVTLNDLAVEAFGGKGGAASKRQREVGKTLAAVCEHHAFETTT